MACLDLSSCRAQVKHPAGTSRRSSVQASTGAAVTSTGPQRQVCCSPIFKQAGIILNTSFMYYIRTRFESGNEPSQEYQVTSEERGPLTAHSCAASKVQCPPQDPAVLPVQRCPLHAYSATAHVSNLAGQLSHCSVIVKRHHGQGNLRNLQKCLIGSLLIVFRGESRTITVGSIAAGRCWDSSS